MCITDKQFENIELFYGKKILSVNTPGQQLALSLIHIFLGDFDKGNSKSQTSERTGFRGIRRLRERVLLRRERLHKVLKLIGFLPQHYIDSLDFSNWGYIAYKGYYSMEEVMSGSQSSRMEMGGLSQ